MGVAELGKLVEKTGVLRDTLVKSKAMSDEMLSILSSFDTRLAELERSMRPIQEKTHSCMKAHVNIEALLAAAEMVLAKFNIPRTVEPRLREGAKRDLEAYLAAMDQLDEAIQYFGQRGKFKDGKAVLQHAGELKKHATDKLQTDFKKELNTYKRAINPAHLIAALPEDLQELIPDHMRPEGPGKESSGEGLLAKRANQNTTHVTSEEGKGEGERPAYVITLIPPISVYFLQRVAQRMVAWGQAQSCTQMYRESRSLFLLATLEALGVERVDEEEVQRMAWDDLEGRIGSWIAHMRISIGVLFTAERQLCDEIFAGADPHRERVFAELTDGAITLLLSFGSMVAESPQAPEKLFALLDMFEVLRELTPQMESVFSGQACIPLRASAQMLEQQLADTARGTFAEFEDAVERDTHRATVADGTVHPLTSYVINYVKFLFDYESTLAHIFGDIPTNQVQADGTPDKTHSRLAQATQKILAVLLANLEAKSKVYKDQALVHVFLMNNTHYMVRSIKKSDVAAQLLGNTWVERHRRIVQQHASTYQRTAWGKLLGYLTTQGLQAESNLSKNAVKDRFKNFNAGFEELHQRQCQWTVPDPTLKDAVILSIAEVLLPAYGSFERRYRPILESHAKSVDKYIRYRPAQLEAMLVDFFTGKNIGPAR